MKPVNSSRKIIRWRGGSRESTDARVSVCVKNQASNEREIMTTENTQLAIQESIKKVEGQLTEFDRISAGLADLEKTYGNVAYAVTTMVGMAEAKAARVAIRTPRFAVEAARKAAKSPVLALGKDIEARAKYITDELLKIETPIDGQIKAEETRKENEKLEKAKKEQERIAAHMAAMTRMTDMLIDLQGRSSDKIGEAVQVLRGEPVGESWEEFQNQASATRDTVVVKLISMQSAAKSAEEAAAKLAEERAEIERQRIAQAEIDLINAAVAKEAAHKLAIAQAELERDRKLMEQANAKAESERNAKLKAEDDELAEKIRKEEAVRAESARVAQAELDAKEAKIAEDRKRLEDEQAAYQAQKLTDEAASKMEDEPVNLLAPVVIGFFAEHASEVMANIHCKTVWDKAVKLAMACNEPEQMIEVPAVTILFIEDLLRGEK